MSKLSKIAGLGLRGIVLFVVVLASNGCGGDSSVSPENFDIVGSWSLTKLERASGNYSSDWVFKANNTYDWQLFVELLGIDEDGVGNYTLSGDTLFVSGVAADFLATNFLKLSLKSNSFSFLDEDGDRWTYSRR